MHVTNQVINEPTNSNRPWLKRSNGDNSSDESNHSENQSSLSLHHGSSKNYDLQHERILKYSLSLNNKSTHNNRFTLRKIQSQPNLTIESRSNIVLPSLYDPQAYIGSPLLTTTEHSRLRNRTSNENHCLAPAIKDVSPSYLGGSKDKLTGSIKQGLGKILRRPRLEAIGCSEQVEGQVRIAASKHVKVVHF